MSQKQLQSISLLIILLIALGLRLYQIDRYTLWEDERISASCAVGIPYRTPPIPPKTFSPEFYQSFHRLPSVIEATIQDNGNASFYNSCLSVWIGVGGFSSRKVRLLSVLIGMLLVWMGYQLAYRLTGKPIPALATALLLAFHPLMILYSQEVRGLQLASLLGLTATWVLWKALYPTSQRDTHSLTWIFYGLLSLMSMLTTYLCAYIYVVHVLYVLGGRFEGKQKFRFVLVGAMSLGGFVGWLLYGGLEGLAVMQSQYYQIQANVSGAEQGMWLKASPHHLVTGVWENLLYISGNFLQTYGLRIRHFGVCLGASLGLAAIAFVKSRKMGERERGMIRLMLGLAFGATFFFLLLALIAGHITSLVFFYCQLAVPYMMFLFAYAAFAQPPSRQQLGAYVLVGIVGLMMLVSSRFYTHKSNRLEGDVFTQCAETVKEAYEAGDTIVYGGLQEAWMMSLYLRDKPYVQRIDSSRKPLLLIRHQDRTENWVESLDIQKIP